MKSIDISRAGLPAVVLSLAACAGAPPVVWPPALEPGPGEVQQLALSARGVQIYECRGDAGAAAWAFVAPEATLFDASQRAVGRHGAGPFWQLDDGSRIVGTPKARADAPVADAIPWLWLTARSEGGAGALSTVTAVRRLHTAGGTAPRDGCDAATRGRTARVPYSADYHFYAVR